MAKTREQKKEMVKTIEGVLKSAPSSVFVHFTGINVAQETTLRKAFLAEQLGYTVAKKTLIRRALSSLGHDHEGTPLDGEIAIAYNLTEDGDPTLAARRVHGFARDFGVEKLVILGGIYQGQFMDAEAMRVIATIPSIQVLRGMFVNVINSPIQRLAIALDQIAQSRA